MSDLVNTKPLAEIATLDLAPYPPAHRREHVDAAQRMLAKWNKQKQWPAALGFEHWPLHTPDRDFDWARRTIIRQAIYRGDLDGRID